MIALLAHGGALTGPHDLLWAWTFDPLVLAAIAVAGWWYATGVRATRRGRGTGGRAVVSGGQVAAFALALLAIVVALISPVDAASGALFSVHMVQHVLLTLVAAPLIVLAAPLQVMGWGLPAGLRRAAGRWQGRLRRVLWRPALAGVGLASFAAVFLAWHIPALYDAAIASDAVHATEHATMLGAALAFWAPIVRPRRVHPGLGVLLLFVSMILSGILSALLVFAPTPWYAHEATGAFGLTRLADQQAAGAVMWVFGGAIHVAAGAAAVMRWLRLDERTAQRAEVRAAATAGAGQKNTERRPIRLR